MPSWPPVIRRSISCISRSISFWFSAAPAFFTSASLTTRPSDSIWLRTSSMRFSRSTAVLRSRRSVVQQRRLRLDVRLGAGGVRVLAHHERLRQLPAAHRQLHRVGARRLEDRDRRAAAARRPPALGPEPHLRRGRERAGPHPDLVRRLAAQVPGHAIQPGAPGAGQRPHDLALRVEDGQPHGPGRGGLQVVVDRRAVLAGSRRPSDRRTASTAP